ncbi:MAG: anaerobic ribonucleoside-triphosphate reductase activating protein [Mycoplasmataceae bacterium]|nr:anaerobic ribonucleoside-triphosphate reductase activating protein [Mycoplasmataceae bacterium]
MRQIRLSGIAPQSLVNGQGLRKVYFSQGCTHHCKGCFNPETWSFKDGQLFDINKLVDTLKDESYLDGVTFSGGDPLQQAEPFSYLAEKVKQLGMNIWCYTGYTWNQVVELMSKDKYVNKLIRHLDIIVDGIFVESLKDDKLKYRGSSNQRIIDVQQTLKDKKITEILM